MQAIIVGVYYNNSNAGQSSYFHFSIVAFLIACSSGMIFFEEKETRVNKILSEKFSFSIIITICVFTVLGLYVPVSKSILRTLKMGATPKATILVEKAGCMLIRSGADALNCASINKEEVLILWRQSEYCLQITENGKHRMVILDSSLVKGVSYR